MAIVTRKGIQCLVLMLFASTCLVIIWYSTWFESPANNVLHEPEATNSFSSYDFHHRSQFHVSESKVTSKQRTSKTMGLSHLSNTLLASIARIQNPVSCKDRKKFICDLSKLQSHDVGLVIHAIVACHLISYGLGRVLLIVENPSFPLKTKLSELKRPKSHKCFSLSAITTALNMKNRHAWSSMTTLKSNVEAIKYTIEESDVKGPHPVFVPGTMPPSLRRKLVGLHQEPVAWFIGHFVKYHLAQNQDVFEDELQVLEKSLNLTSPAVGLYLRSWSSKTGKLFSSEADFVNEVKHNVGFQPSKCGVLVKTGTSRTGAVNVPEQEYVEEADLFLSREHPTNERPQIFLSSDDSQLKDYYTQIYGEKYEFLELPSSVKVFGAKQSSDGIDAGYLRSLLGEIHFLAKCDYVICTFSSHVCRLIYELKLASSNADISSRVLSLDYNWGYDYPGYSWAQDLSIRVIALHNGHYINNNNVSYSEGDMFDLFSWFSYNETEQERVLGVRQRNVKNPKVGVALAKYMHILVNMNNDPPYIDDAVFQ